MDAKRHYWPEFVFEFGHFARGKTPGTHPELFKLATTTDIDSCKRIYVRRFNSVKTLVVSGDKGKEYAKRVLDSKLHQVVVKL